MDILMREFEAKVQKWGNSYAIRIPKEAIDAEKLRENAEVHVLMRDVKRGNLRSLFGSLKGVKIDAQKVKDDIRASERRARRRKYGDLF